MNRDLTFIPHSKIVKGDKWIANEHGNVRFVLKQGSVFVLSPQDETPTPLSGFLHKSKHKADFKHDGISVALVFRSIRSTALATFVLDTNRCWWKNDPNLAPKLAASVQKHCQRMSQRSVSNPTQGSFNKMTKQIAYVFI